MSIPFLLFLTTTPPEKSIAADVDCDKMEEKCKDLNPYHWWTNSSEHAAYDIGCMTAGKVCRGMLDEVEVEGK
jgi:hypothetical protein